MRWSWFELLRESYFRLSTDTDARECGEQTGLETPVVHTVNDGCKSL